MNKPTTPAILNHYGVKDLVLFARVFKKDPLTNTALVILQSNHATVKAVIPAGIEIKPGLLVAVQLLATDQWKVPRIIEAYTSENEQKLKDNFVQRGLVAKYVTPDQLANANLSVPKDMISKSIKDANGNINNPLRLVYDLESVKSVNIDASGANGSKLGPVVNLVSEGGQITFTITKPETEEEHLAKVKLKEQQIQKLRAAINYQAANEQQLLIKEDGTINVEVFRKGNKYTLYDDKEIKQKFDEIYKDVSAQEKKELENYLTKLREVKKCMEDSAKESTKKTKTFMDQIGDQLINDVVLGVAKSVALDLLNSLLPDYLKVNVVIERDQDGHVYVKNFSVGAMVYDVQKDTVTVSGDVFNPFINSGVDEVNKLLPPFLQVSASELGLEIGEIVIQKNELEQDVQKEYRVRDDIIVVNGNATTYIQMRGQKFSLGRATDIYVDRSISYGLEELNKVLPDLFYVSVRRDPEDNSRVFDSGPFSIKTSGKNAGLSVDQEKLKQTIEQLPEKLLTEVPAPLQASARALWSQASKYIVEDILYSKATEAKREQERKERERASTYAQDKKALDRDKERLEIDKQKLQQAEENLALQKEILDNPSDEDQAKRQQDLSAYNKEQVRIEKEKERIEKEESRITKEEERLEKEGSEISPELVAQAEEEVSSISARYDACVAKLQKDNPKTDTLQNKTGAPLGAAVVAPSQGPSLTTSGAGSSGTNPSNANP